MKRSGRVRAADVMKSTALLGECLELGSDRVGWAERLNEGLQGLLDAQVVIASELTGLGSGEPDEAVGLWRTGWANADAERRWRDYAAKGPAEQKPEYPVITKMFGRERERGVTLTRDAIWGGTAVWARSRAFNEVHRVCGIDDYIFSIRQMPKAATVSTLWVHRAVGEPGFTPRERRLLALLHDQIATLVGGALASGAEPGLRDLPPRPREVLGYLLKGLSEKEIAAEMGLSKPTVHEHATRLYRHFDASTRAELLARFIGRFPPRPLD